jgi:hypothetical protein
MARKGLTWKQDGTLRTPSGVIVGKVWYEGISYSFKLDGAQWPERGFATVRGLESAASRACKKIQAAQAKAQDVSPEAMADWMLGGGYKNQR